MKDYNGKYDYREEDIFEPQIIDEQENTDYNEFENNLDEKTKFYLSYISESNPNGVRKVLYKYGFPVKEETDFKDLYDRSVILVNDFPDSYDDFLKQSPEFKRLKQLAEKENKKGSRLPFTNFTSTEKTTENNTPKTISEYDILLAKTRFTTNLMILGVASIFLFLTLNKKL